MDIRTRASGRQASTVAAGVLKPSWPGGSIKAGLARDSSMVQGSSKQTQGQRGEPLRTDLKTVALASIGYNVVKIMLLASKTYWQDL